MPIASKFIVECDFCGYSEEFFATAGINPKLDKWYEVFAANEPAPQGKKIGNWYDSPECAASGMKRDQESRKKEREMSGVIA